MNQRQILSRALFTFAGEPAAGAVGGSAAPAGPLRFDALALPYDVEVPASPWGDVISFAPGSVATPDEPGRVKLLLDHRVKPFGYATGFAGDAATLTATLEIPRDELDDPEVAAAVRQMRNGVRDAVSVGVDIVDFTAEPVDPADKSWMAPQRLRVTAAELVEISSVVVPRFADARHQPLAAARPQGATMTMTATPTEPEAPPVEPTTPPEPDDIGRRAAHMAAINPPTPVVIMRTMSQFGRFASLGAYARARWNAPDDAPDLAAAWLDQITSDNPGVMQPSWVSQVKGIVDLGRPFITALGGPQHETALDVSWPYFDGDLKTLVGVQAAQKTDITSVKVSLKRGTDTMATYAGGSDISIQLIEKSEPSYLDAYERIMFAAYAAVTDNAAVDQAYAAAPNAQEVVVPISGGDAKTIATAVFEASVKVQLATGSPASVVVAASDIFPSIAGAIASTQSPTANTAGGSMNAATLEVRLAGLSVTHDPYLPPGTALVTNRQAYVWAEDGPRTMTAFDVPRLGRDVAVYGYGKGLVYVANGLVKLVGVASPLATGTGGRSSK